MIVFFIPDILDIFDILSLLDILGILMNNTHDVQPPPGLDYGDILDQKRREEKKYR